MAKNRDGFMIAGAIIVMALLLQDDGAQTTPTPTPTNGGTNVDLCKLVDGSASFTGQRMFVAGTALTGEHVRVIRVGSIMDLGYKSLNSGTVSTTPNANYKLYWGENSSTYYTHAEMYQAPCQDAADDKVGVLCTIDTSPTITVFNENGVPNADTSAEQDIGQDEVVTVEVKIKATADECYGNPQCAENGKSNAICFEYNTSVIQSVKASSAGSVIPYSLASSNVAGEAISCYESQPIKDTGSETLSVTITPASGQNPTDTDDITISYEDCAFDLNADTLEEIWGFQDEDNNNLGDSAAETAEIYLN